MAVICSDFMNLYPSASSVPASLIMQHHINQLSAISAIAIRQPALQQDWTTHLSAITATTISHQPATTAAEKDREWQTQLAPEFYVDGASTALRSEFIQHGL